MSAPRSQDRAEASGVLPLGSVGEVELNVDSAASVAVGAGGALDLSVRSLFVPSAEPAALGTFLTVNLKLGNAHVVKLLARVRERVELGNEQGRLPGMTLEFLESAGASAGEQLASCLNQEPATSEPRWMTGIRVLVADDDEHYRETCAQAMRDAGFDVLVATNGFEALSLALKEQPGAIISDVNMPGMDGWQLLRMVRSRPALRRTPFIFLTDLKSDEERLRGYQLGVDDYVVKPFAGVELIARVERVIERASAGDRTGESGMRGDLDKVPIASLLAFAEMERRTAVLHLIHEGHEATLHLRDGAVVRIELGESHDRLAGFARFLHVLDWESGRFELLAKDVIGPDVVGVSTSYALLEHARLRDEARHNANDK